MSKPRFFAPQNFVVGNPVELDTEQSRHAIKSRRLKLGDSVELLNGEGQSAIAELLPQSSRSLAVFTVKEVTAEKAAEFELTIAVAVPKGDRQKVLLDMLTQLGVSRIVPLNCDFSSTRANDKLVAKWRRLVIESCKQSGRVWFPEIELPLRTVDCANLMSGEGVQLLIADPKGELWQEYCGSREFSAAIVCFIGPEGGFSETEVRTIVCRGARRLAIASHILRIETAAVAIASLLLTG